MAALTEAEIPAWRRPDRRARHQSGGDILLNHLCADDTMVAVTRGPLSEAAGTDRWCDTDVW